MKKLINFYQRLSFFQGAAFAVSLSSVVAIAANNIPGFFTFAPNTVISSSQINSNFDKLANMIEANQSQTYVGTWDAATNVPDILVTAPSIGSYYVVSTAGVQNSITFAVGDWVIWNGSYWDQITPAASSVPSVYGRTGAIAATEGDYSLDQLADVSITSPVNGQTLMYNGTSWAPGFISYTETDPTVQSFAKTTLPTCSGSGMLLNSTSGTFSCGSVAAGLTFNTVPYASGSMFMDSPISISGVNVGIGTMSPAQKLDVAGNINASGSVTQASDKRLKKNIFTINSALEKIQEIRGVEFDWRNNGTHDVGVIAQEVEKVIPDLVITHANGSKSVKYANISAVLIESTKELNSKLKYLEHENQMLKTYLCQKDPEATFCE